MSDITGLSQLGAQATRYSYEKPDKAMLETFRYESHQTQLVGFKTDEFTSLCPKTGQPDFASLDIVYLPRVLGVESKSLKLYLFSFRNHGSFHEDCMNRILSDLQSVLDPLYLRVIGDFTKRGGIAIKPISEHIAPDFSRPVEQLAMYDGYAWQR